MQGCGFFLNLTHPGVALVGGAAVAGALLARVFVIVRIYRPCDLGLRILGLGVSGVRLLHLRLRTSYVEV